MSIFSHIYRKNCKKSDTNRDQNLSPLPEVKSYQNLNYKGNNDKYNCLDLYLPKEHNNPLPVLVSVHGGAYVYGTKEVYFHYGQYMAAKGFAFVNFNYHLAPEKKFPTQLSEINDVMSWILKHGNEYNLDTKHIFITGDSAGAQMTSQYLTIYSNPDYAALFDFSVPEDLTITAGLLNCGMYDVSLETQETLKDTQNPLNTEVLMRDYLGKKKEHLRKHCDVLNYITKDYPPVFVMTSYYDFLKEAAKPMADYLTSKGVKVKYKLYGTEADKNLGHVFHVNMNLDDAKKCNDDESEFLFSFLS